MNCLSTHLMRPFTGIPSLALTVFALLANPAQAVPPTAPTQMVTSITSRDGSNYQIRFEWIDNSTDEDGFRLFYRLGLGAANVYGDLPVDASIKAATGPLSIAFTIPAIIRAVSGFSRLQKECRFDVDSHVTGLQHLEFQHRRVCHKDGVDGHVPSEFSAQHHV